MTIEDLKREFDLKKEILKIAERNLGIIDTDTWNLNDVDQRLISIIGKEKYIDDLLIPSIIKTNQYFDCAIDIIRNILDGKDLFIVCNDNGENIINRSIFLIWIELEDFLINEGLGIEDNKMRLFIFRIKLKKVCSLYSYYLFIKNNEGIEPNIEYMVDRYTKSLLVCLYKASRIYDIDLLIEADNIGIEYKDEVKEIMLATGGSLGFDLKNTSREYSATSQILALEYLLDSLGVRYGFIDKTNVVRFIQFITNRETGKEAKNTNIYKQLWKDRASLKPYKEEVGAVSKLFEDMKLDDIAKKIRNSID